MGNLDKINWISHFFIENEFAAAVYANIWIIQAKQFCKMFLFYLKFTQFINEQEIFSYKVVFFVKLLCAEHP